MHNLSYKSKITVSSINTANKLVKRDRDRIHVDKVLLFEFNCFNYYTFLFQRHGVPFHTIETIWFDPIWSQLSSTDLIEIS